MVYAGVFDNVVHWNLYKISSRKAISWEDMEFSMEVVWTFLLYIYNAFRFRLVSF